MQVNIIIQLLCKKIVTIHGYSTIFFLVFFYEHSIFMAKYINTILKLTRLQVKHNTNKIA